MAWFAGNLVTEPICVNKHPFVALGEVRVERGMSRWNLGLVRKYLQFRPVAEP